jgi:hypothetical protein
MFTDFPAMDSTCERAELDRFGCTVTVTTVLPAGPSKGETLIQEPLHPDDHAQVGEATVSCTVAPVYGNAPPGAPVTVAVQFGAMLPSWFTCTVALPMVIVPDRAAPVTFGETTTSTSTPLVAVGLVCTQSGAVTGKEQPGDNSARIK